LEFDRASGIAAEKLVFTIADPRRITTETWHGEQRGTGVQEKFTYISPMKPVLFSLLALSAGFLGACASHPNEVRRVRDDRKYASASDQQVEVAPKPTPPDRWFDSQIDPTGRPKRQSSGQYW
jgi:hypothetical protein